MNAPQAPQVQAEPEAVETIEATMGPLTGRTVQSPSASKKEKAASAFRTISEVADDLRVQQHVLRFWETKFSQIRPLKRGGGRRYYRPEDVEILKTIHRLLYSEGYTIKGVQKLFREKGKNQVMAKALPEAQNSNEAPPVAAVSAAKTVAGLSSAQREALQGIASELRALRELIQTEA